MNDEIKVYVIDKGRKFLYLRYLDPLTGRHVERSAETSKRGEAGKAAGKWQAELIEGRYQKPSRMTWEEFRDYYSAHALPGLSKRSAMTYESTLNVFETHCNPQRLWDVTTARVTAFVTSLRLGGSAEATIAHHLRGLKAMTRWAHRQGLLNVVPQFSMPKRAKGSKLMHGRPITTEEFERMLVATSKVVDNVAAPSWQFYQRGLWESGLRLSESLTLRWEDGPDAIVVDFSRRRPMFRIPAEAEKGNQDRLLPMTPQFAALLETVPEHDCRGRVFKLLAANGQPLKSAVSDISKVISRIGKAAGVVVDERTKRGKVVRKFASAHDLRRAFGFRWSRKVMPVVLRELMRHASLTTTLAYYVGEDAEATADALWLNLGDTLVDTNPGSEADSGPRHAKRTAK